METEVFDKSLLIKVANTPMPFGKYKDRMIIDLPEAYLLWFSRKGYPKGELGQLLQLALEIDMNGLKTMMKRLQNG